MEDVGLQWAFWRRWAILQAEHGWRIYYKDGPPPHVMDVRMNVERAVFEVAFEDGSVFTVEVSGVGRVSRSPDLPG